MKEYNQTYLYVEVNKYNTTKMNNIREHKNDHLISSSHLSFFVVIYEFE